MRWVVLTVMLAGCSPKMEMFDENTKYPNTPTMQSAEDAMKGKL